MLLNGAVSQKNSNSETVKQKSYLVLSQLHVLDTNAIDLVIASKSIADWKISSSEMQRLDSLTVTGTLDLEAKNLSKLDAHGWRMVTVVSAGNLLRYYFAFENR